MKLIDNDSTASLTDRERSLLAVVARCINYIADLNGSQWIDGDDSGSEDMRQRARALQRIAFQCIESDADLYRSVYGDA